MPAGFGQPLLQEPFHNEISFFSLVAAPVDER